ncbi:hypothetical protein ACFX11_030024 [Malus domestica]
MHINRLLLLARSPIIESCYCYSEAHFVDHVDAQNPWVGGCTEAQMKRQRCFEEQAGCCPKGPKAQILWAKECWAPACLGALMAWAIDYLGALMAWAVEHFGDQMSWAPK